MEGEEDDEYVLIDVGVVDRDSCAELVAEDDADEDELGALETDCKEDELADRVLIGDSEELCDSRAETDCAADELTVDRGEFVEVPDTVVDEDLRGVFELVCKLVEVLETDEEPVEDFDTRLVRLAAALRVDVLLLIEVLVEVSELVEVVETDAVVEEDAEDDTDDDADKEELCESETEPDKDADAESVYVKVALEVPVGVCVRTNVDVAV